MFNQTNNKGNTIRKQQHYGKLIKKIINYITTHKIGGKKKPMKKKKKEKIGHRCQKNYKKAIQRFPFYEKY